MIVTEMPGMPRRCLIPWRATSSRRTISGVADGGRVPGNGGPAAVGSLGDGDGPDGTGHELAVGADTSPAACDATFDGSTVGLALETAAAGGGSTTGDRPSRPLPTLASPPTRTTAKTRTTRRDRRGIMGTIPRLRQTPSQEASMTVRSLGWLGVRSDADESMTIGVGVS